MNATDKLLAGRKIMIATPVDGDPASATCAYGYGKAIGILLHSSSLIGLSSPWLVGYPSDLVRARSRLVRQAIVEGIDYVLWLDSDVIPKPGMLGAMIESGHDIVGCPYPRKRLHWERVGWTNLGEEPEHHAYTYAYQISDGPVQRERVEVVNGCMPVRRLGMGCMLTSVRALSAMVDHYRDELWCTDVVDSQHWDIVAIFQLLMGSVYTMNGREFRALFSEDYSFCERYARMIEARPELGFGPAQMLVSHPADHVGGHVFRGNVNGLIYAR